MCLTTQFWTSQSSWKGNKKAFPRDKIITTTNTTHYLLWNNTIAVLNKNQNTLFITDCDYQTKLTYNRLNKILKKIPYHIYTQNKKTYIQNTKQNKTYTWEGNHTINLKTQKINPANQRKFNHNLSQALKTYHKKAKHFLQKQNYLYTLTLDGATLLFIKPHFTNFNKQIIYIQIKNKHQLHTYITHIPKTKLYTALKTNNTHNLINYIKQKTQPLQQNEIFKTLEKFNIDTKNLPQKVLPAFALQKILEI